MKEFSFHRCKRCSPTTFFHLISLFMVCEMICRLAVFFLCFTESGNAVNFVRSAPETKWVFRLHLLHNKNDKRFKMCFCCAACKNFNFPIDKFISNADWTWINLEGRSQLSCSWGSVGMATSWRGKCFVGLMERKLTMWVYHINDLHSRPRLPQSTLNHPF